MATNVAVVGTGIAGSSAARFLAARGYQVTIFEQFIAGHDRGSSHGASRIIRRAYPDAFYTKCMAQAYPMWRELEQEAGHSLVSECGLVYFGDGDSKSMQDVVQALVTLEVPHEVLEHDQVRRVFPALRLEPHEVGVWTPEAGWVDADGCVAASLELALHRGARLVEGTRISREELERDFDMYVVCAGAWIRDFVNVPVKVTLQTFAYVVAEITGPVWIEDGEHLCYGFPAEPHGTKSGVHWHGPEINPDSPNREPQLEPLEIIKDCARRRFGVVDPQITAAKGCLYTSTNDEDFLFGRVGSKGYFASACSGHGFKFGPWIGKLLAGFVDGSDAPENYPRFFWS